MFETMRLRLNTVENTADTIKLSSLLIFIGMAGIFASDMYVPSLPAISQGLHATATQAQLSITYYIVGLTFAMLFYGPLSDRIGRRPVILIGITVSIIGVIFCLFSHTITHLLIGRVLQGLGMAALMSLTRTVFADVFNGNQMAKILSYYSLAFALAPAVAPLVGGFLQHTWGWHAIFILLLIYSLLIFAVVLLFMPETNKHKLKEFHFSVMLQQYKQLLNSKIFMRNVVSSSVALSALIVYYTISPFLLQDVLGFDALQYAYLAIPITLAIFAGRFLNIYLLKRMSMAGLVVLGNIMSLVAAVLMLALSFFGLVNVYAIIGPMMIIVVAGGLVLPNASASALGAFRSIAGASGSLYGCLQLGGAFAASAVAAEVSHQTQLGMAWILVAVTAFSVLVCLGLADN